jgi:hypothetical protein
LLPDQKNYDQSFLKIEIEVHYLSIETKKLTTKHKQHFESLQIQALGWSPNGKYKLSNPIF